MYFKQYILKTCEKKVRFIGTLTNKHSQMEEVGGPFHIFSAYLHKHIASESASPTQSSKPQDAAYSRLKWHLIAHID